MTPEDLQKLKNIRKVAAALPQELPATQLDDQSQNGPSVSPPSAVVDPYTKASTDYTSKATDLEAQAAQTRPQPHGAKENLVSAARAALENLGKFGAPGGSYGQDQLRQQEFDKQNAMRLAQAKDLRGLAEKQDQLGISADVNARNARYQEGELANKRAEDAAIAGRDAEIVRHNKAMEGVEQNKPIPEGAAKPDGNGGYTVPSPKTPTAKQLRIEWADKPGATGVEEAWAVDENGGKVKNLDMTRTKPAPNNISIGSTTDAAGNPVIAAVDKKNLTVTPLHMNGATDQPALTSDQGKANAKEDAKLAGEYEQGLKSLAAMKDLVARGTYASDQALGDQFFNVVKPGSGARMNETQINRFMSPGPLKDKAIAWAQKLDQGQPLTPADRQDLYESARIVVNSKKTKPRGAAAPAPAASAGAWKVVH